MFVRQRDYLVTLARENTSRGQQKTAVFPPAGLVRGGAEAAKFKAVK